MYMKANHSAVEDLQREWINKCVSEKQFTALCFKQTAGNRFYVKMTPHQAFALLCIRPLFSVVSTQLMHSFNWSNHLQSQVVLVV